MGRVANASAVAVAAKVAAKVAAQHGAMHSEEEVSCVEQAPPESQRASYNSFSDRSAKSLAHSAKQYQDANSAHIHYNQGGGKTEIKSEAARSSVSPDPVGWLLRVIGDAATSSDGDERSKEEKSLETYEIRKCARQEARCTESVSPSGPEGMKIDADTSVATDGALCNGEARGVRRGTGHNLREMGESERLEFLKLGARDVGEGGGAVIVASNTFCDRAKTPREDHSGRLQSPSARRISHFDSKSPRAEARDNSPYREEEADEYGEIPIFIGEEETTTHTATTQNATQTATLVALQNMLMDKGETHEKGIHIKQSGHDGCESKK